MTMSRHGPTVPLHAIEEGRGQPIVLSHALGMDLHSWDALAARLARDYTVLRPDHRGHGASPAPAGPYSMDALVEDTAALLRARGDAPVVWVGLSMGGMVGLGLAIRHPELLRGLVVAHACAHYPDAARAAWNQRIATVAAEGIGAIADAVMGRYFHRKFRVEHPDVEAIARRTLLATPLEGYLGCCHAVRDVDWRAGLESIRMPVLVIAGQFDEGVPLALSQTIARAVPGARLQVLQGASHIGSLEQPERFEEMVRAFLCTPAAADAQP